MNSHIDIIRDSYTARSTIGKLYTAGEYFSYTLEDTVRASGIKVPGETAIPAGTYKWQVTHSSRFKRDMICIYTEDNGYELKSQDISFKGLRIHGGNTHENTEGCPLVAKNYINENTIQGTMEKELTAWAKKVGGKGTITIANTPTEN